MSDIERTGQAENERKGEKESGSKVPQAFSHISWCIVMKSKQAVLSEYATNRGLVWIL